MTQKQSFHLLRHSQNEAKTVEKTHELSIVPQKVGDKQFGKYKKKLLLKSTRVFIPNSIKMLNGNKQLSHNSAI